MVHAMSLLQYGNGKVVTTIKCVEESHLYVGPMLLEVEIKGLLIFKKIIPNTLHMSLMY